MKTRSYGLFLFAAMLIAGGLSYAHRRLEFSRQAVKSGVTSNQISPRQQALLAAQYGKLPLAFEKNAGQSSSQVRYISRGKGFEMFLTADEAVLALRQVDAGARAASTKPTLPLRGGAGVEKTSVLRMSFAGANHTAAISATEELPGKSNYFAGNDPKRWLTNVPSYARVTYQELYPGIDATFYGNQQKLEYDLVVSPGANPQKVEMDLVGTSRTRLDGSGNLVAYIGKGQIQFDKPVAYQNIGGERRQVAVNYALDGSNHVKFEIADYDRTQPLVIDPVLDYSTYLGGSSTGDFASGIAVDATGNAYLVGTTSSSTFPVNNAIFATPGTGIASGAAFVTKLNPTGTAEVYSTYLSGDTGESGFGIAVDALGNAYVTGQTKSTNFPTTVNAFSQSPIVNASGTGFLTKIDPTGATLLYSTLLGGTNGDEGFSVAADAAGTGNAYVTGATASSPGAAPLLFTVQGGFQTTLSATAPNTNAFLVRIDTTQIGAASLIYSTYLGGTTSDTGFGIAVDTAKGAYIVGTTNSNDFPAKNAFASAPTGVANGAVFVTKINTTTTGASSLLYSSYISGSASAGDFGEGIALGPANLAYLTGQTLSASFPVTTGSYPSLPSSQGIVFVTIVDTTKTGAASVTYSTIIGGTTGADQGFGIKADTLGNAYVSGSTRSSDFPVTPGAFQSTKAANVGDAFVLKLQPGTGGAASLLYSTYFGGSVAGPANGDTLAFGLALDATNNVYVTGETGATDFPTFATGTPFQASLTTSDAASVQSAFASKLTLIPTLAFAAPCTVVTGAQTTSCALTFANQLFHTASTQQTFTVTNNTSSNITTINPTVGGTNSGDFSITGAAIGGTSACGATLAAGASCGFGVTFTPSISGAESGLITVTYNYNNGISGSKSQSQLVAVSGTGTSPTVGLSPTSLTFVSQPTGTTSTAQTVTVTNSGLGNLVFSVAPAISGDYAIASTTCSTSTPVAASGGTCTINVTFTPTATGTRSGTLTLTDNATTSPQTVALTGTGATAAAIATVTPTTVPIGGQLVTTTSAAQTVTVKNTGNATLNLTAAPVIGGTNASDFAIASGSTCTSTTTLAANATCLINITFTPPAAVSGSRSATLSIADNASGSPQTVTLSGTAWDFSIAASPITVKQGSSGTINVTVTGLGGFTGAVTLSCTGSIPQGSCTAQSTPVSATAAGATGTVTIATHGSLVPPASRKTPPTSTPQVLLVALAALLLLMLPVTPRFRTRIGLAGVAALLVVVAGCSGALPTPPGTDSVTITGTSGSVSHSATTTVTVD